MMYNHKLKVIKDPVYGNIPLSYIDSLVLSSSVFNRLHNIRQNGIAYMVYPGAITTRFLHSVGVMHLATECFIHAIHNTQIGCLKNFLEKLRDEVKYILESKINYIIEIITDNLNNSLRKKFESANQKAGNAVKSLYGVFYKDKPSLEDRDIMFLMFIKSILGYSKQDAFFDIYNLSPQIKNELEDEKNKENKLDKEELYSIALFSILAVRLAGLLHDVGHLPFSHCLEDIIEYIYDNLEKKFVDNDKDNIFDRDNMNIDEKVLKELKNFLGKYCRSDKKLHEIIGIKMINIAFYDLIKKIKISNFQDLIICFVLLSLQLVVPKILDPYSEQNTEEFIAISALKNVISSGVDVDRLDFCIRDNMFSGLDSGRCDLERIIKFMTLVESEEKIESGGKSEEKIIIKEYYILPSLRTLNTVEDLLICRFNIYKYLCCHHKIIRLGRILKEIIKEILIYELSKDRNKIKLLTGSSSVSLEDLHSISVIFYFLRRIADINDYRHHVKHILYVFSQLDEPWLMSVLRRYYHEETIYELQPYFEDLFGNSKNFKSLWKRFYQYKYEFLSEISTHLENIEDIIREVTDAKKGYWVRKVEDKIRNKDEDILIESVKDKFSEGGLNKISLYDSEKDEIIQLSNIKKNLVEYIKKEYYYEIPDFFVFYKQNKYDQYNKLEKLKQKLKDVAIEVLDEYNTRLLGGEK